MASPGRATWRCLRADLTIGWENETDRAIAASGRCPSDRGLHQLNHPIVVHTAGLYQGDADEGDVSREKISSVTAAVFWKVKSSRWRGAVWVDPLSGQAWLCAAGLRREDEHDDFYERFSEAVARDGAEAFLPSEEDRDRLSLEEAHSRLTEWQRQVIYLTLEAVVRAIDEESVEVPIPGLTGGQAVARLLVEIVRSSNESDEEVPEDAAAEVAIQLRISDYSDLEVLHITQVLACSVISPQEQDWDAAPDAIGTRIMATVSEARLSQLKAAVFLDSPELSEIDGTMSQGTVAHYTSRTRLASSIIFGRAVRAACGIWWVPRQDHMNMPICEGCREALAQAGVARPPSDPDR